MRCEKVDCGLAVLGGWPDRQWPSLWVGGCCCLDDCDLADCDWLNVVWLSTA